MGIEAKLFKNGGSQAVRIPKEFRFSGSKVIFEQTDAGLLIKPAIEDEWAWLTHLQALADAGGEFMPGGREQPPMPPMKPEVAEFFGVKEEQTAA